ncbi:MAG: hypothetical protein RBR87_13490 [Bacteroidales bacterium]|nr:hypothetical protein [Bacteroidales bacterium]
MKIYHILFPVVFMLLSTIFNSVVAQNHTDVTSISSNDQEPLLIKGNITRDNYWLPLTTTKGIYFDSGHVGIGTANPSEKFLLHVVGIVGVNELVINEQYSLPTERGKENEFLNGLGEWKIISSSVGGENLWQPVPLTRHIYYDKGRVGVGTTTPGTNLHVKGNMNVGNNFHNVVGTNAFVGGNNSQATGDISFAFGNEAYASGLGSIALGYKVTASGLNSVALGENVKATMRSAFVAGRNSQANSISAIALGHQAFADGGSSVVIGNYVQASASEAFVFGSGAGSVKLVNNNPSSLMIGYNSNYSTFFVSSSAGAGTTGNIGIGNMTDPQAKLHIYSDADKPATLKLEHRTTGTNRYAEIGLGTHRIRAGNFENMVFSTPATNRHFIFENGNVGIGTSSPKEKLSLDGPLGRPINFHIGGSQNIYNNAWYDGNDKRAKQGSAYAINFSSSRMAFRVAEDGAANSQIAWNEVISLKTDGNVGIGTIDPQANLEVKGDVLFTGGKLDIVGNAYVEGVIYSEEVIVEEAANWPDYVFEPDYQLMGLADLKNYIQTYKHLPDTPKADENGTVKQLKMSEMNALLLKKIEELTLYMLEQEERINKLEER